MRSDAVNQANSSPCIFSNVRKGFGRLFARFNTGLSMCFHRIVQNPFFRLLGHLNPIGKEGIFTVCLVGYISKAVVKEHLCADLFAVFAAYGILLYSKPSGSVRVHSHGRQLPGTSEPLPSDSVPHPCRIRRQNRASAGRRNARAQPRQDTIQRLPGSFSRNHIPAHAGTVLQISKTNFR